MIVVASLALGVSLLNTGWLIFRYFRTDSYIAWGIQVFTADGQDRAEITNGGSASAFAVRFHVRTPDGRLGTIGREFAVIGAGQTVIAEPGVATAAEHGPNFALTWSRRPGGRQKQLIAPNNGAMDLRLRKLPASWRGRIAAKIAGS